MNYPAQKSSLIHTLGFKRVYPSVLIQLNLTQLPQVKRLEEAIEKLIEILPQIACGYDFTENCFYLVTEKILQVIDGKGNIYDTKLDFLHQPQVKIYLRQQGDTGELIMMGSHIFSDASGFKQLLYALIALYNGTKLDELGENQWEIMDVYRSFKQKTSSVSRSDLSEPLNLPFASNQGEKTYKMANQITLSVEELAKLKAYGKQRGFSLNDSLLAGYMRFLAKYNPTHSEIQLACPTDTRQFLAEDKGLRVGNYTARYNPIVSLTHHEPFWQSVAKVHEEMALLKRNREFIESIQPLLSDSDQSLDEIRASLKQTYHPRKISYTNMMTIDEKRLNFEDAQVVDAFMSGSFRKTPGYQVCFNTFRQQLNLVCTVEGSQENQRQAMNYLFEIKQELLTGLEEE